MKYCDDPSCDGEYRFEPPLQDGALGVSVKCEVCSSRNRQKANEDELERLRRAGRAAGNMWAHLAGK